jgi:hypothetical protein
MSGGESALAPTTHRFHLRRVHVNSHGYDSAGAYWGLGAPIWEYEATGGVPCGAIRAKHRDAAKATIRARYPGARFYR